MYHQRKGIFLMSSAALIALISVTSSIGLLFHDFYAAETDNWKIQSIGQDSVDLFLVVPVMMITVWAQIRGNRTARLIWPGILLYVIYTFVIFCFDVHFNRLFIFYCLILGISVYSLLYFLYQQVFFMLQPPFVKSVWSKIVGIYLLVVATSFYFLWLAEIGPSIVSGTSPQSLLTTGLLTNPVHVLDLSIVLPGIGITAILMLRKHPISFLLASMVLTFFILMDITIAVLSLMLGATGMESNTTIALIMLMLALLSGILQFGLTRSYEKNSFSIPNPLKKTSIESTL